MERKGDNSPLFQIFYRAPTNPEAFGFFLYEIITYGVRDLLFGLCNYGEGSCSIARVTEAFSFTTYQIFGEGAFLSYLCNPFFSQLA